MPIDGRILKFHRALNLPDMKRARREIKDKTNGWRTYQSILEKFKLTFPTCDFSEINLTLYLMDSGKELVDPLNMDSECIK